MQLIKTIHDFATVLDMQQFDVICVDFAKAFEKVPHNRLMIKLSLTGLSQSVLC